MLSLQFLSLLRMSVKSWTTITTTHAHICVFLSTPSGVLPKNFPASSCLLMVKCGHRVAINFLPPHRWITPGSLKLLDFVVKAEGDFSHHLPLSFSLYFLSFSFIFVCFSHDSILILHWLIRHRMFYAVLWNLLNLRRWLRMLRQWVLCHARYMVFPYRTLQLCTKGTMNRQLLRR